MKRTVSPFIFFVLLAACTKNDVVSKQSSIKSATAQDEAVSDDCKTIKWVTDKDVYPRLKKVTYNGCQDEYGYAKYGSIFFGDRIDEKIANPNDLVRTKVYGDDYYIRYSTGELSTVSGKSNWFLVARNGELYTYSVSVKRKTTDEDNNIQVTSATYTVQDIDAETVSKTGSSVGTNKAPNPDRFISTITAPLIRKKGFQYAVSGRVRVQSIESGRRHLQVLDYGNGELDNKATISVDGAPATEVTLPLEGWAEYLEE